MTRKTQTQETAVRTRRAIVQRLKQEGRLDAETLASHLGITAMAVRQHLYALQDEQLITYQEEWFCRKDLFETSDLHHSHCSMQQCQRLLL